MRRATIWIFGVAPALPFAVLALVALVMLLFVQFEGVDFEALVAMLWPLAALYGFAALVRAALGAPIRSLRPGLVFGILAMAPMLMLALAAKVWWYLPGALPVVMAILLLFGGKPVARVGSR